MYRPPRYQKDDPEYIYDFIKQHPFATVVTQGQRLLATHIPVLAEGSAGNFKLYAHIANHNEMRQHLQDGAEMLLIFKGADAYVSSSWYSEKDISTWDYSAVHVNATITLQSQSELEESLEILVNHFESREENPLYYRQLPRPMLEEHLPLITGFVCHPTKVEGVAKLHQGYRDADIHSAMDHLRQRDDAQSKKIAQDIERENKK